MKVLRIRSFATAVALIAMTWGPAACDKEDVHPHEAGEPTPAAQVDEGSVALTKSHGEGDGDGDGVVAPAGAQGEAAVAAPGPSRATVTSLAVASECMRKAGATDVHMNATMVAMIKAQNTSLEAYTKALTELSKDPEFIAGLTQAVEACPASAASDTAEATQGGEAVPAPTDEDVEVVNEGGEGGEGGEAGEGDDAGVALEVEDVTAHVEVKPKPPASMNGTYRGEVSGSQNGKWRVSIQNKEAFSARITVGGVRFSPTVKLSGRKISFHAKGAGGRDYLHFKGTVNGARRTISGSWNGVVGGKRANGRFSGKR